MKRIVITALSVYLLLTVGAGHLFHDHAAGCHAPHTGDMECTEAELRVEEPAGSSAEPELCAVCQLFKQLINSAGDSYLLHDPAAVADDLPVNTSVCEQLRLPGQFATRAPPAL